MTSRPANVTAVSVGVTSAQAVPARLRNALLICNNHASATVAFSFGGAAALTSAGSITLAAGARWSAIQELGYAPSDQINMIASGATTPVTVVE